MLEGDGPGVQRKNGEMNCRTDLPAACLCPPFSPPAQIRRHRNDSGMGEASFGGDGVELALDLAGSPEDAESIAMDCLRGDDGGDGNESGCVSGGDLGESCIFKLGLRAGFNSGSAEPAFEFATQGAVLGRKQGGGTIEIPGKFALQLPCQFRHRTKRNIGGGEDLVKDLARDAGRGRFVREHDIKTMSVELGNEVGQFALVTDELHGGIVFEDRAKEVVTHQFGKGVDDPDMKAKGASAVAVFCRPKYFPAESENLLGISVDVPAEFGESQGPPAGAEKIFTKRLLEGLDLCADG